MKFFSYNSPFWSVTSRIFDFMLLNFLWFITSIPVITIGASTAALFSVISKIDCNNDYIFKIYFKNFLKYFKKSTFVWFIYLTLSFWLILVINTFSRQPNYLLKLFVIPEFSILIIALLSVSYIFALCSQEHLTPIQIIKESIYTALLKLPISILIFLCALIPIIISLFVSTILPIILFFWIFFGISSIIFLQKKLISLFVI